MTSLIIRGSFFHAKNSGEKFFDDAYFSGPKNFLEKFFYEPYFIGRMTAPENCRNFICDDSKIF